MESNETCCSGNKNGRGRIHFRTNRTLSEGSSCKSIYFRTFAAKNHPMETPRASDTIDLSKTFVQVIRLLAQNILAALIVFAICIGTGFLYYSSTSKVFESKMIIQSDILSESYSLKLA